VRGFRQELVEFNGEGDHVHLLVEYPPRVAFSKLVNSLKGVSSRMLRRSAKTWRVFTAKGFIGQRATSRAASAVRRYSCSSNTSKTNAHPTTNEKRRFLSGINAEVSAPIIR
jgi:REP element-mobilizing transposase RayT